MTKVFQKTNARLTELEPITSRQRKPAERPPAPANPSSKAAKRRAEKMEKLERKRVKRLRYIKRQEAIKKEKRTKRSSGKEKTLYTVGGKVIQSVVSGGLPSLGKRR